MHVAMVTPLPPDCRAPQSGVDAVAICLIRALIARGVRITVIKWGGAEAGAFEDDDLGCRVVPLRLRHPAFIMNWLAAPDALNAMVGRVAPDLVHVQDVPELGRKLSGPRVLTVHGINPRDEWLNGGPRRYLTVPVMWATFLNSIKTYPHVTMISPYSRQAVRWPEGVELHDIDNPIEDRFFDSDRRPAPPTVMAVGALSPRKNTLGIVRAAAWVREAVPDVQFRFAGGWRDSRSSYRRQVERVCAEAGLDDTVAFLGPVPRERLTEELSRASCLVLPSFHENAPVVLAEAMAARVAVVASRTCGIPYLVDDGRTGLLIDPHHPQELADATVRVLTDEALRSRLVEAGRAEAEARWRPDAVAQKVQDLYGSILAEAS